MKKTLSFLVLALLAAQFSFAQKTAFIDSQAILEKMPGYKAAQEEIDQISAKWQEELEDKYKEIEEKYKNYQAEEVLLPDDVKKKRQEEIFALERAAKEFKQSKFGYDGELYKIQDEKIRPVQDQVFEAVEKVAKAKRLNIIFDRSGNSGMIYADPLFDRTKDVMNMLGIKE